MQWAKSPAQAAAGTAAMHAEGPYEHDEPAQERARGPDEPAQERARGPLDVHWQDWLEQPPRRFAAYATPSPGDRWMGMSLEMIRYNHLRGVYGLCRFGYASARDNIYVRLAQREEALKMPVDELAAMLDPPDCGYARKAQAARDYSLKWATQRVQDLEAEARRIREWLAVPERNCGRIVSRLEFPANKTKRLAKLERARSDVARFTREVATLEKAAFDEQQQIDRAYEYAHLLDDEIVMHRLVSACGDLLRLASERLQDSELIVLAAVAQYGRAMHFASERLHDDYEFVHRAVRESGMALVDAHYEMALCHDLAMLAVRQDGMVLEHLYMYEGDDELALAAVQQNGLALRFAQKTPEIILAAVQQNGMALRSLLATKLACWHCHETMGTLYRVVEVSRYRPPTEPRDVCSRCITFGHCGNAPNLRKGYYEAQHGAPQDERANEFALAAVSSCGRVLEFLDAEMRGSEEIVRAAIASSYGRALEWASRALRGNEAIVLAAVALDERALQFAGPELQADAAFMTTVAAQNPRVTRDTVAAQAHLERLKKKRRQWNDSRAAENRKHARKETKRHAQESTPPETFHTGKLRPTSDKVGSIAARIPDLQLLAAARNLWSGLPDHNTPELAAIKGRNPMFVRLSAADVARLKPAAFNGWARDDAVGLLDLYAGEIVQKLSTRDKTPNAGLSVNIGLGALQTRWCFCCGEFMRQHRVDRHTKSGAHKSNVKRILAGAKIISLFN